MAIVGDDDERFQSPVPKIGHSARRGGRGTMKPTRGRPIATSSPSRSSRGAATQNITIDLTETAPAIAIPLNHSQSSDEDSSDLSPHGSPLKSVTPLEPGYKSYHCRWQACHAELHSFDTLEQHVLKVHGKPDKKTKVFHI
jgi:hypothetical protein